MNGNLFVSEYKKLCADVKIVYVVPLINYSSPQTDYLYRLYEQLLNNKERFGINIVCLSVFAHSKLLLSRLKNEKSVLHYHWFEATDLQSLVGMIWKILWIVLFRIFGGKIVWTVHNKFPHRRKFLLLNKIIRICFAHLAHRLHVHCEAAIGIMSTILKVEQSKFFIVKVPEFPVQHIDRQSAREMLTVKYPEARISVQVTVFLMFGAIAEYKGIIETVDVFTRYFPDNFLIIAGRVKRWDKKYYERIQSKTEGINNIIVIPKAIPEADVPLFINSSDCMLFNYLDILTSASVALALSYEKPIIAPTMGCLQELRGDNVTLFNAGNKDEFKKVLMQFNERMRRFR